MLTVHHVAFAMVVILLTVITFVCFMAGYLRYYFNRHEPAYVLTESGAYEKHYVASRFCKMVLSNTVNQQCLDDPDNVGLWMLSSNIASEFPKDTIMNIHRLHEELSALLKPELDATQYEKLRTNMIKLELTLDSHLLKSKIPTPPYIRTSTYAIWVSRVLTTLNKA